MSADFCNTGLKNGEGAMVLLFLKAPAKGTVKTRLAAVLGSDAALDLYRCFIQDGVDTLIRTDLPVRVCFTPSGERERVASLLPQLHDLVPQEGKDLGERMENAFRRAFAGGCTRAVLLGSDIPDLPGEIVHEALTALISADLVLGPAHDGGYYLIGMTRSHICSELFRSIPWSTARVFGLTLQRAKAAGLKVHVLPEWRDVDSLEDLRDLVSRNRGTAFSASRTMASARKGVRFCTHRAENLP